MIDVRTEFSGTFEPEATLGDSVAHGDTLARIRTWQRRLKVKSPVDGRVAVLCVWPDEQVVKGDLLFQLEPDPPIGHP